MPKKKPKNIFGFPYNIRETINWILKHITVNFYYPFMFLIYFLFVSSVATTIWVVSTHWYYIFTIVFILFFILYIYRRVQISIHKIANIGTLNEDGWREFKFLDLIKKNEIQNLSESEKNLLNKLKPKKIEYRIGFVGDIMKMDNCNLNFEKRIIKFFKDVDLIVGNLEGIITDEKSDIVSQRHNKSILTQLSKIFNNTSSLELDSKSITNNDKNLSNANRWLLCVSNNHAADFGEEEFKKSVNLIKEHNFNVFGDVNESSFEFKELNFVSGTMWSNKKHQNLIAEFFNYAKNHKPDKFNIFFPHWHYENEPYVRSKVQRKTINLILEGFYTDEKWRKIYHLIENYNPFNIKPSIPLFQRLQQSLPFYKKYELEKGTINPKWDLIFGHHPHVPQPIKNYGKGVLAFSGGNFTSSKRRKKHISGMIMKCEIGRVEENSPLILGNVYWCYTINDRRKKEVLIDGNNRDSNKKKYKKIKETTVIIDCIRTRKNYFENRSIKFRTNFIIFTIALGIWLSIFWILGRINYIYWIIYALLVVIVLIYFGLRNIKVPKRA
ncbi:MAG: CapA family protein [Promethearchaeota archaeon]